MRSFIIAAILLGFCLVPAPAQERSRKEAAAPHPVPYRLTDSQHVLVRVKINGKGPFNFIVDTGAPIMFVATPIGKKLGLETDEEDFATLEELQFEGGLTQNKVKVRVETPFQLDGMNGMGLAGAELHGILGYTVLAKYRMTFDFTRHKMEWTPLDFEPPPPFAIGGKGAKGGAGGLEIVGSIMKFLGPFLGLKKDAPSPGGFFGLELEDGKDQVKVARVYDKGPAAEAGLKAGDRIETVAGKSVKTAEEVRRRAAQVEAGQTLSLVIYRGDDKKDITITAGEGL
jgi:hypothetical protein